uniref:SFBBbeta protein n=1 Tax=Solanum tuberosum TaxID=4113 RepID=M1DS96_SOLTU
MDDCVVYFTEDIVKEIVLRCPLKSLLRFKCVRKSWYALIKNPKFVQQQLKNHSSPQLLIYTNGTPDDPDHEYSSITLISEENPQTFKDINHPRKPQKAALSFGRKEKEISSVRRLIDCRFLVKINVTKPGNENRRQTPRATAWRPVWMQVGDVPLVEDEEILQ